MDRRGFLKVLGVGGVSVVAAPQLVLPKARPSAGGDARIFVPPAGGWLPNETALLFSWRQWSESWWRVEIERYVAPGEALGLPDSPVAVGDREGWLVQQSIDYRGTDAIRVREQYEGDGPAPAISNDSRFLRLTVEQHPPREPLIWGRPNW